MTTEKDDRELQELESEFGELFTTTRQEPTSGQLVVMRQRAIAMASKKSLSTWWHSLRWMGAGAAVAAASLLALVFYQNPIETNGPLVAINDVVSADIRQMTDDELEQLPGHLALEEFLADDYFADESEWASITSMDLFYGPMPGDDPDEWDGVYDHLLAQNMADEFGF